MTICGPISGVHRIAKIGAGNQLGAAEEVVDTEEHPLIDLRLLIQL